MKSLRRDGEGRKVLKNRASDTSQPGRVVPDQGKLHDGARFCDLSGTAKGVPENRQLVFAVEGPAGRVPEGVVHEKAPGRLHEGGEVVGGGKSGGRNPRLFDGPGDQSHGLMAERSGRHQKGQINTERLQARDEAGDHLVKEPVLAEDAAHEGEVDLRKTSNEPLRRQLPHPLDGEDAVDILFGVPVVVVVVADPEFAHVRVRGDLPEGEVVLVRFERGLVPAIDAAGADQRHPALC